VHLFCNWVDEDFVKLNNGNRVLRLKREKDNFVKAYYRRQYWKKESNREKAKKIH
jgi:DNA-directed RNA polymerase